MAGWADLVANNAPLIQGHLAATAGTTWTWAFTVSDSAGNPLNWTTEGVTVKSASLYPALGVAEVDPGTLTVALGASGLITISATAAATATLAAQTFCVAIKLQKVATSEVISFCTAAGLTLAVVAP